MRIKGISTVRERDTFVLVRKDQTTINIPICAVLPSDDMRIAQELLMPVAPAEPILRNGKPMKGDDGQIVTKVNEDDEIYRKKLAEYGGAHMVAWIVAGTAWGPDFALETDDALRASDPRAYYLRVMSELSEIGFSTGDIARWYGEIRKLTSPSRAEVVAAKERFQDGGKAE